MLSIARSGIHVDCWYPIYDPASQKVDHASATHWPTVLRKPHGSVLPVKSFLITDADYVEVLTEIGIQTPVPNLIKGTDGASSSSAVSSMIGFLLFMRGRSPNARLTSITHGRCASTLEQRTLLSDRATPDTDRDMTPARDRDVERQVAARSGLLAAVR